MLLWRRLGSPGVEDLPFKPLVLGQRQWAIDFKDVSQIDEIGESRSLDLALLKTAKLTHWNPSQFGHLSLLEAELLASSGDLRAWKTSSDPDHGRNVSG